MNKVFGYFENVFERMKELWIFGVTAQTVGHCQDSQTLSGQWKSDIIQMESERLQVCNRHVNVACDWFSNKESQRYGFNVC